MWCWFLFKRKYKDCDQNSYIDEDFKMYMIKDYLVDLKYSIAMNPGMLYSVWTWLKEVNWKWFFLVTLFCRRSNQCI